MASRRHRGSPNRSARAERARRWSAPVAVRRSLPYDPLSDAQRVFSLFGGPEIPPARRSFTVRPLIRTVVGDTRKRVLAPRRFVSPESRFISVMNNALPLGRPSLCARRSVRREVIFARGGQGKGSYARKRYTSNSFIRCRR